MSNSDFKPTWHWLRERPVCFFAFGFGLGLSKYFPGTLGTLLAFIPAFLFAKFSISLILLLIPTFVLFLAGVWAAGISEKALGRKDYSGVVIDEITSMMFILSLIPVNLPAWLGAFLLFRLLDIVKPYPIGWLDKNISGGWGCMSDDLAAGAAVVFLVDIFFKFFIY